MVHNDRKAELTYQTNFDEVPQVLFGLCHFNFNLNFRDEPVSYGYGSPPQESNAIGVRMTAHSSKTTLTIEGQDLSFGDTLAFTADVCYQACSIGPGSGPVDH